MKKKGYLNIIILKKLKGSPSHSKFIFFKSRNRKKPESGSSFMKDIKRGQVLEPRRLSFHLRNSKGS